MKNFNSKFKICFLVVIFIFLYFYIFIPIVSAQVPAGPDLGTQYGQYTGLGEVDPRVIIARIVNIILALLGAIAVVIILLGGFQWMTAAGNEEKVGKAKKLLIAGIIGLAIILAAYGIAKFVISELIKATTLY